MNKLAPDLRLLCDLVDLETGKRTALRDQWTARLRLKYISGSGAKSVSIGLNERGRLYLSGEPRQCLVSNRARLTGLTN